MQGRNREEDIEKGLVDTEEEDEGGTNWESSVDINTLPCVKQLAVRSSFVAEGPQLSTLMTWRGGMDGGRRL